MLLDTQTERVNPNIFGFGWAEVLTTLYFGIDFVDLFA